MRPARIEQFASSRASGIAAQLIPPMVWRAAAVPVDQSGDQFFTGSCLSGYQDVAFRIGDIADLRLYVPHRRTLADHNPAVD
jgi:hypothetical protein